MQSSKAEHDIFISELCCCCFFAVAATMCWFPCLHVVCCFYYSDEFIRWDSALIILLWGPVSSTWQIGQQRFYKIHNLQWFINSWSACIHIMGNTQGDVTKYLVRSQQQFPSVLFQVSLSDWQMCGTAENHLPLPVEIWVLGHWGKHRKLTMCLLHCLRFNILMTLIKMENIWKF